MIKAQARFGERGASMVEFALAATALLVIMFGIVDFGRALYTYHTLSNAARLGTRYAIVRGSDCASGATDCPASKAQITTFVQGQAPLVVPTVTPSWSGMSSFGTTCDDTSHRAGCLVTVQTSFPFNFLLPFMPANVTISSQSQMVVSQ